MEIRSLIERVGGTKVPMDGAEYHFKPITDAPGAPHVCTVTVKAHIGRFLSIVEGYEVYLGGDDEQAPETDDQQAGEDAMLRVINDPDNATPEDAILAFHFLEDRAPDGRAKHETVVAKIIKSATEQGYIAPEDAEQAE